MNKKYRILIDMDDVMENLTEEWLELLKFLQRNNPKYIHKTYKDITNWDMCSHFPMLTVDEVFEPLNTDIIWELIRPIPGAVEVIRKYNEMSNVEVRLLTSSHYTSIHPKREFLRKYFPFIKWNQIIISSEKQYVRGNVLIDDYEGNLIDGEYEGILFDQPHSRGFDESKYPSIIRAKNWNDVDKLLSIKIKNFFAEKNE